ncbi:FAD-binding FR-type domain-containing protein [Lachancea thermotolerans]
MLRRCSISLTCALWLIGAQAKLTERRTKWDEIATSACSHELATYPWKSSEGRHDVLCKYDIALGSWVLCSTEYYITEANGRDKNMVFQWIESLCAAKWDSDTPVNLDAVLSAAESNVGMMAKKGQKIDHIVRANEDNIKSWVIALFGPVDNLDKSTLFAVLINGYWLAVLLIAAISKFFRVLFRSTQPRKSGIAWIKGHITLPPLVQRHAAHFGRSVFVGLIPTRLETLVIAGYICLHVTVMCVEYHFDPLSLVSSLKIQHLLFTADRAGILAFAHLPFLVLSGGRNQLISKITGIKLKTMIGFHKWAGRLMFVDVLIHALGYYLHSLEEHYLKYAWDSPVWQSGRAGVCACGILIFFSFYFFRRRFYELFLFLHYLMAVIFIYECWRHCSNVGWMEWIYVSIGIWVLEFVLRARRVIKFGFPRATIELSGDEFIKITVPKLNSEWQSKPGQYVYLYFLRATIFWQSHPFSILHTTSDPSSQNLTFVITAKNGVTKKLRDMVKDAGTETIRIALEGPYGSSLPLWDYDSVLLLGGGTGIASMISASMLSLQVDKARKPIWKVVWSLKSKDLLNLYGREISELIEKGIDVQVFLTSQTKEVSFTEIEMTEQSKTNDKLLLNDYRIPVAGYKRPDINSMIEEFMRLDGSLLVIGCGPPAFVDSIRSLTCEKIIENPLKVVDYKEDYQTW